MKWPDSTGSRPSTRARSQPSRDPALVLPGKRIGRKRRLALEAAASRHVRAERSAAYPDWYLHRWHLLPEGYMSPRGVALYERLVAPLYYQACEARVMAIVAAELGEASDILELGCGPGHLLVALAAATPGRRLTGVDLSPYMLGAAAASVGSFAALRHADSAALPFAGASFEAVVAMHHLGHVPPAAAAAILDEAHRVLRPGGRLLVVDHRWHAPPAGPFVTTSVRLLPPGLSRLRVLCKQFPTQSPGQPQGEPAS